MSSQSLCVNTGLRRCLGKRDLHQRVMRMFLDEQQAVCSRIDAALAEEGVPVAIALVHALVSRAGLIGAETLSQRARAFEEALRDGQRARWSEQLQALREEHALVLRAIPDHLQCDH